MADGPDVIDPLRFLREREVVHFQRFGEALRIVQERLNEKPFFVKKPDCMNADNAGVSPAFDSNPFAGVKGKK